MDNPHDDITRLALWLGWSGPTAGGTAAPRAACEPDESLLAPRAGPDAASEEVRELLRDALADGASTEDWRLPSTASLMSSTSFEATVAPIATTPARFGDYLLGRPLGRGGMGVVLRAWQTRLNRPVALKMIRRADGFGDRALARFQQEVEAAARLDHPGIVPVYEVGELDGQPFYSMAFVDGPSLSERVRHQGPLESRGAAELLRTIADAVHYAHERGVVHRDIKPHNILLDSQGRPRVADFGLAKLSREGADELTHSGQVLGTPAYMPPEQARGDPADVRADVYSLGATMYHLLTGRAPFQASSTPETLRQVLELEPAPPRSLNPEISTDLETICLACLRKEPERRYPTARALAKDLGRYLAGEPITARRVGPFERAVKFARRRPAVVALALVGALATAASAALLASLAYQREVDQLNTGLRSTNDRLSKTRDHLELAQRELAQQRYASDLAIAARAAREGDHGRSRQLLDRHVPSDGAPDLRGFEWEYLRQQGHRELWRGRGEWAVLHPDGGSLLVAQGRAIQRCDLAPLLTLLAEGATSTSGLDERTLPSLEAIARETYGACSLSGDGRLLAAPMDGGAAGVWELPRGRLVARLDPSDLRAGATELSPDGSLLLTLGTGTDHALRVFDISTGAELWRTTFRGYASFATFSPDGELVAFHHHLSLEVVDARTGMARREWSLADRVVQQVAFQPDGARLVVATDRDELWTGSVGGDGPLEHWSTGPRGARFAFSRDGARLLTALREDNSLRLWDVESGDLLSTRQGHAAPIAQVGLHRDQRLALSQSASGEIRLWDLHGDQRHEDLDVAAILMRHVPGPGPRRLLCVDSARHLHLWEQGGLRAPLDESPEVRGFATSSDGARLLTWDLPGASVVWDLESGRRLRALDHQGVAVINAALRADGQLAATYDADHHLRIWDVVTGAELRREPAPTTNNGMVRLYFPPGERSLIAAHAFDGWQIVPLDIDQPVRTQPARTLEYDVVFSPDGSRLAAPGMLDVRLCSYPDLRQEQVLQGHRDGVSAFCFSPDGRRAATGSRDGQVRIWDVATGQELLTLESGLATQLSFSPDGRQLVASDGRRLRIWGD